MLEISNTGVCSRHGLQVSIHPDDAKDRVLMAIVEALLDRNNRPTSTKELASLIIQQGYTRLGGYTPHGTVASRISLHFKRATQHEPPRPPLLARHNSLLNTGKVSYSLVTSSTLPSLMSYEPQHNARSTLRGHSSSTAGQQRQQQQRQQQQRQPSKIKTAVTIEGQQHSSNTNWPHTIYIPPMASASRQSTLSLVPPEWSNELGTRYINDLSPSAEQFGDNSVLPSTLCHLDSSLFLDTTLECDFESTYLGTHQTLSPSVDDSEPIHLPSLSPGTSHSNSQVFGSATEGYPSNTSSNVTSPIPADRSSQPELTDDSQSLYDSSSSNESGSQLLTNDFIEYSSDPGDDMHAKYKKNIGNDDLDLLFSSTIEPLTPATPLGASLLAELLDLIHDNHLDFTALQHMVSTESNLSHLTPALDLITNWIVHLKQQRTSTSASEDTSSNPFDTLNPQFETPQLSLGSHQQEQEEHQDKFGFDLPTSPTTTSSTTPSSVYFTQIENIPVCVAQLLPASDRRLIRRLDLDYIEGTSLLAAGGVDSEETRGIILGLEKDRLQVRKSDSGLYGTWIPLVRARKLAATCSIQYRLDPFLDDDLGSRLPSTLLMDKPRRTFKCFSSSEEKKDPMLDWAGSMGTRNGMFVEQARCVDQSPSVSPPRPLPTRKRKRRPLSLVIQNGNDDYGSSDDDTDTDPEIEQLRKRLKKKRQAAINAVDRDPAWDDLINKK
ncbi:hypothetical protein [Absidia glauca]|uniref:HTH APSES-type domain-containing protein n=1 Tax=Absidia glauca TaxID=4829 RepID=A0A168PIG3_ABSGL|nr:hypothetical protein [Absidia glauca]